MYLKYDTKKLNPNDLGKMKEKKPFRKQPRFSNSMASKQGTTLEGFPLNVSNAPQRRDALDESQDNNEPHNSNMKKRRLSNVQTTESQIEKRKREAEFDDEETMLRDRFLDELDSLESPQISNKEIPMEEESSNEETTFFQDRKIIKCKFSLRLLTHYIARLVYNNNKDNNTCMYLVEQLVRFLIDSHFPISLVCKNLLHDYC
jgi:hypothetical protein